MSLLSKTSLLTTTDATGDAARLDVKFADLTDDRRDTLQTMLVRTRNNIAAHIKLIAMGHKQRRDQ